MWQARPRAILVTLDAFAAATAVAGGVALATGREGDRFPTDWLRGTPFRSYVLPGAILAGVVGGSAVTATLATLRQPILGGRVSALAGGALACWIAGEIALLSDDAEGPVSPIEALYAGVGLAMMALGVRVARATAPVAATA